MSERDVRCAGSEGAADLRGEAAGLGMGRLAPVALVVMWKSIRIWYRWSSIWSNEGLQLKLTPRENTNLV